MSKVKLPLLSSRCGLKHALGVVVGLAVNKLTNVRTFAHTVLDECLQGGQTLARRAWVMSRGGSRQCHVRMRPPMLHLRR